MGRVQAFDSTNFRVSDPGFGDPGVKSWNGLTGVVKGTLAEIYGFGLGDSPSADNLFAMPERKPSVGGHEQHQRRARHRL